MKSVLVFFLSLWTTAIWGKSPPAPTQIDFSPERTIVINGAINDNMFTPTIETMDKLAKSGKVIDIILSSPGGSVIAGSLLIDRMEQLKLAGVTFRCAVRDVAASMAFQILLHCNERYATPHSFLLWHPVRVFMRGPLTADMAQTLFVQLAEADEMALHDLRAYLPMDESELMWHFKNETLHQAFNLKMLSPTFFKRVTNNITNLYPEKPALDTAQFASFFGLNQIIYIHERFAKGVMQ